MSESEDKALFEEMIKGNFPDQMVSNWIIIIETVDDKNQELKIATSEGMTTWLATGMLNCASEIVLTQGYGVDMEEDEQ